MGYSLSRTAVILIVSWLCVFSTSEAVLGASCNGTETCAETIETCALNVCNCSTGYFNVSGECKSRTINVTLSPPSINLLYGSNATLTASISSDVPVSNITWQKVSGGTATTITTNSTKYIQIGGTGSSSVSLIIKNLDFQDRGSYQVYIINKAGTPKNSSQVSIDVTGGTINVTLSPPSINLLYGSNATLTASISSDVPVSNITWQKVSGGTATTITTNSTKYIQIGGTGSSSVSLIIKNLDFQDRGSYQVYIINKAGTPKNSSQVSIDVTGGTINVTLSPPSINLLYGSNATLTASISSDVPVSNITWQKVSGGTTTITTNSTKYIQIGCTGSSSVSLIIKSLDFQDRGSYQVHIINKAGTPKNSSQVSINVTGALSVITGGNVSGRIGGRATIDCNVTGPEPSSIKWIKYTNNNPTNITIDNTKYSGGLVTSAALIINSLVEIDAAQYQCTASNPGGSYKSENRATVTVKYGQFNENCTLKEVCDPSKYLECSNHNKCLCNSTSYHKENQCHQRTRLAPTNIELNSSTNTFSVFWNNPSTDYVLISNYEVKWRVTNASVVSSGLLERALNQYTRSENLMSGQLYIVNVISYVNLTEPTQNIAVSSVDRKVRLVPLPPGPILTSSSIFSHNNLMIKWAAPVNTTVTIYRVSINGTTQNTSSTKPEIHFIGKVLIPGSNYTVKIVTLSGTPNFQESIEYIETIRITPIKPDPPTNVRCPESPLDVSLEISWTAPNNSNGRIVMYKINVREESTGREFSELSDATTIEKIEGLNPEQKYTFTVQTINDAADSINHSDKSSPVICETKAGVSGPPTNLILNDVQSRGFHVEFDTPDNVSGVLAGYKIQVLSDKRCIQQIQVIASQCDKCMNTSSCPTPIIHSVTNISLPVSYGVTGLNPYTQYMVKVAAVNGVGEGYIVNGTTTTDEEVPQKPYGIIPDDIEAKGMTLSWSLIGPSPGNTTFRIDVHEANDDGTTFKLLKSINKYGFDNKLVQVNGLEEYWSYKFKVNAATVKGNNTSNFSSVFRTLQAAPGQVVGLNVQRKGEDYRTAYVSWKLPALRERNGILIYYLFRNNKTGKMETEKIPVSLSQPMITVEKNFSVMPETYYYIEVLLENNASMQGEISSRLYEASSGPPPVSSIIPVETKSGEHKPTTYTITLDINTDYFTNEVNGKQVFFGIAVCAVSKCKDPAQKTIQQEWKTLHNWYNASKVGFPMYRVTNDTFMEKVKEQGTSNRQKRSPNNGSAFEITIGEDQTCFSSGESFYCNGPLDPGNDYNVIIFACTKGGCTWSMADGPFMTKKIIVEEPFPLAIVIGVCVAVVVVSIIVGVVIVIVRRRNSLGKTNKYTEKVPNTTSLDEPFPKNIPRKRPIKLKELCDKVAEKHKDSNLHFAREYEDLKALSPKHPAETSEYDENKLKNRYVNILPFDHSRVKLMLTEDDDPSTDFINANYLPGYKSQREYIATQGPIPGTIDDFWRMIWEQNVSIIVMLTLCKEEGRVKCEMYWPENIHEPKQYGDLVVETVSCSTVNFYDFRIFKIKLGDTTRSVKHFHFLQWKDFSANVQNDVMIDFIKNVRNHIRPPDMNGPVVVHCSAGVGRTGTYCALDHLFQFVDEHDLDESIDIFDLVLNLRERRMFMVQTEQQYVFIHDCVRDYVERKRKELQGNLLYENINRGFVSDEPEEDSLYQNYSNQRTDL